MARWRGKVKGGSNSSPPDLSSRPALRASSMPLGARSTSVQPVKRFSRFQVDSPCRSSTSLCIAVNYNVRLRVDFVRNNLLLVVVALVSGGMLLWPLVRRTTGGPWVNAAQATQLINREDALVIDVREPNEYAAGHVLGAKNVPLARMETAGAEVMK